MFALYVEVDESAAPDVYPRGTHKNLSEPRIPRRSPEPESAPIIKVPDPIFVGPVPLRNWYISILPELELPTIQKACDGLTLPPILSVPRAVIEVTFKDPLADITTLLPDSSTVINNDIFFFLYK